MHITFVCVLSQYHIQKVKRKSVQICISWVHTFISKYSSHDLMHKSIDLEGEKIQKYFYIVVYYSTILTVLYNCHVQKHRFRRGKNTKVIYNYISIYRFVLTYKCDSSIWIVCTIETLVFRYCDWQPHFDILDIYVRSHIHSHISIYMSVLTYKHAYRRIPTPFITVFELPRKQNPQNKSVIL